MCLSYFGSEELLDKHISYCQNNKEVIIDFPNDPNLYFKNYHKKLKLPFFYADFDSLMLAKSKIEPHQQISATYTIWFLLVYEIFDDAIGCNLDPFVDSTKNDVAK